MARQGVESRLAANRGNKKAPADFPPAQQWIHRLKGETQADPADAIISCFGRHHRAGVNEDSHMRGEAKFHAAAKLSKPQLGHIELVTATAKDVGSESALAQRDTQSQIGRSAVDKGSGGVFRISFAANTDVPGDEVIDPRSETESGILPNARTRQMLNGVFPERTSPERVHGQFAGSVIVTLVVTRGFRSQD